MNVTANEVKNRLGRMFEHAQQTPVAINKAHRPLQERAHEFNAKCKDWIAGQNERVEKQRLWSE